MQKTSGVAQQSHGAIVIKTRSPDFAPAITLRWVKYQDKLACPARFERATYALEEFVAVQKSNDVNDLDA